MTHPIGGARRSASVLLVLLGLLSASAHGSGDFNRWLPATGPEGGNVTQLAIDPTNGLRVFAIVSSGPLSSSLYRTTDGAHWQLLRTATEVTLDPSKPMTMYAVDDFGVAKSTDGGDTWTPLSVPCSVYHLVIEPKRPSTIYAARGGVCASADGGATWRGNTLQTNNYAVDALAVDPQTPGTLYAYTGDWRLLKSTNSGVDWTLLLSSFHTGTVLRVSPGNPNLLLAAGGLSGVLGIGRSLDGGRTWSSVSGVPDVAVRSLLFNSSNPSQVFAAASGGLFVSGDGGGTWVRLGSAVELNDVAVDAGRPGRLYAASSAEEVLRSTDSGSTWQAASSGIAVASNVIGVAADANAPDTVYALRSAPLNYYPPCTDRSIPIHRRGADLDPRLELPSGFGALHVLACGSEGIERPVRKSGASRERESTEAPTAEGPGSSSVRAPASGHRILGSGLRWDAFPLRGEIRRVPSASLYRIRTDGSVWERVGTFQALIALDPVDKMLIYESRADGFYKSTDGMQSWVRLTDVFGAWPAHGPFGCLVNPLSRSDLYCSGRRQTVRSTDGGHSWTQAHGRADGRQP